MRIIIAGASGFLGSALRKHFDASGSDVSILTRRPTRPHRDARVNQLDWDGVHVGDWWSVLEGAGAVVNLCGHSVNCRYVRRNRELILDSRVNSTRAIGEAIVRCRRPPKVWLNASTATIYRHTLGEGWDEKGEIGSTRVAKDAFSVEVAKAWEGTLAEAKTPRTRKVALRTAMVLGRGRNSVFPTLRRLVRLGLGGQMGNGKQFISWIHIRDFCRAVEWLLSKSLEGPVNLAAPSAVSNAHFMKMLRQACGVTVGLPSPAWLLEIGAVLLRTETELILKSRRVIPGKLLSSGFDFLFPALPEAFQNLCSESA
jgi:uncharacterized protein